jgi:hypothetical protein
VCRRVSAESTGDASVFMESEISGLDAASETKVALTTLLKTLDHLPQSDRGTAILNMAAELIETAAYDLAGLETSPRVARLILMSAEVARVAAVVRDDRGLARA